MSRLLAVLSLSTALVAVSPGGSPALAAFEFMSKATAPAPAKTTAPAPVKQAAPAPARPAIVPVTKTDEMPISDLAKPPADVPVWTAKSAPAEKSIPLTPVIASSDSLQMIDGPLLPDAMPAPVAAPILSSADPVISNDTTPAPQRQVLARSSGSALEMNNPVPPVKNTDRDSMLWDNGKAPVTNDITAMTTEKSDVKPAAIASSNSAATSTSTASTWAPLPPPVKTDKPMDLTPSATTKMPPAPMAMDDHPMAPSQANDMPAALASVLADTNTRASGAPEPIVETVMDPVAAVLPADDKIVEGFGTNLPMALALRQIVPPTYRFSFGPNVDPGQRVSWQGGRTWSSIIQDIAAKQGLNAEIAGNVVAIRKPGSPDVSAAQDNMMEQVVMGTVAPSPLMNPPPPPLPVAAMPAKTMSGSAAPLPLTRKSIETETQESFAGNSAMAMTETTKTHAEKNSVMPQPAKPLPPIVEDESDALLPPPAKPLQMDLAETRQPSGLAPVTKPVTANTTDTMAVSQEWTAHTGQSLRAILQDWSKQANVSLVWSSSYDYPLQTDIRIQGTYPDAIRTLLAGFGNAQPKPIGRLHKNANVGAQPVLIVDTPRLING